MIVFDASALLALALREPGHEKVADVLSGSLISSVNFSEVLARLVRTGVSPREAGPRFTALGVTIVPFNGEHATIVAELREHARAAGLGLADCCCLALALQQKSSVLTADRIWKSLGLALEIELVR